MQNHLKYSSFIRPLCSVYLPSIGEGITFTDDEGADLAAEELPAWLACSQSLYWAQQGGVSCSGLELLYFYHSDYLGSVEFVTDMRGEAYQLARTAKLGGFARSYTAFSSRFRFNGKEWDEETGNYYYGARYYDPKISVWLSVDAYSSDFHDFTPYNFVENNPLGFVDPDGNYRWPAGKFAQYKRDFPMLTKYLMYHAENDYMGGKVFGGRPLGVAKRIASRYGSGPVTDDYLRSRIFKWGEGSLAIEAGANSRYNPSSEVVSQLVEKGEETFFMDHKGERVILDYETMQRIESVLADPEATNEQKQAAITEFFFLLGHESIGHPMDLTDLEIDMEMGYYWEDAVAVIYPVANSKKNIEKGEDPVLYRRFDRTNIELILKWVIYRNNYGANEELPSTP